MQSFDETPLALITGGGGIETGRMEIYVPYGDGLSSRLSVVFPWLIPLIEPVLERIGRWGRRRYLARKEQPA